MMQIPTQVYGQKSFLWIINDSEREFWPMWEPVEIEDPNSYVEGSYSVKIPSAGNIKSKRCVGMVFINQNITQQMESARPTFGAAAVVM